MILGRLAHGQSVVAAALALEFEVSEDAIRRDLRALAAEGRCRRVYGGALPLSKPTAPMAARMEEARDRKQALARKAASLVKLGQFVFLDSGARSIPASAACVDAPATLSLMQMNIDLGVLGVCAVSSATGVSAYDLSDAAFKRALLAASRNHIVLVTNEKFAARAAHRVAELKDIDTFVVEHDAPPDALDELAAAGCALMTADRPS